MKGARLYDTTTERPRRSGALQRLKTQTLEIL